MMAALAVEPFGSFRSRTLSSGLALAIHLLLFAGLIGNTTTPPRPVSTSSFEVVFLPPAAQAPLLETPQQPASPVSEPEAGLPKPPPAEAPLEPEPEPELEPLPEPLPDPEPLPEPEIIRDEAPAMPEPAEKITRPKPPETAARRRTRPKTTEAEARVQSAPKPDRSAVAAPLAPTPVAAPATAQPYVPPDARAGHLNNPKPPYPLLARRRGLQGLTVLTVEVTEDGRPLSIHIKRESGHAMLDRAAVNTVKTWRFVPARRGGRSVRARVEIPIRFELSRG